MKPYQKWLRSPKTQWLAWPAWVAVCFLAATYLVGAAVIQLLKATGALTLFASSSGALIFQTFIYVVVLALLFSLPKIRQITSKKTLGVHKPLGWSDIGLGLAGYIIYFIILIAITMLVTKLVPGYVADQPQELGFTTLFGLERMIGFFVFVVVAPIVEEIIFRGFLYGRLRQARMPMWPAAIIVSVLFGWMHGQWNVAVDTFILSMVACYLREITGTIWPGVIIHMVKNAIAFTLLFIVMLPG